MNVNFQQHKEADGTFTVIITFTDVPDEQQAEAAGVLVKRALMAQGAAGIMGYNPFEKKHQ
jgi:hypothetical protein